MIALTKSSGRSVISVSGTLSNFELAVDAEPADLAEPVAIRVEELLVKQRARLLQLRRVAGPQPLIDAQQRFFVALVAVVVGRGVQRSAGRASVHDLDRLCHAQCWIDSACILGDLVARLDEDLARPFDSTPGHDVVDGDLALESLPTLRPSTIFSVTSRRRCRINSRLSVLYLGPWPAAGHRRELAALVDADLSALSFLVTFSSIQLPRSGMNAAARAGRGRPCRLFLHEVDARAAVQLADDDAFGAVDDELAAAEHDRQVAQVDLFLNRLFFGQAEPDSKRSTVGQSQLPALRWAS